MRLLSHLPNGITCLNLLCGYVGIILAFQGQLKSAAFLIFLAGLFDFLDGFVARALKAHSLIGKELDSLADVITFGVLPGILVFKLSTVSATSGPNGFVFDAAPWFAYFSGILPVFSALRLAKFNVDTRQSDGFLGMPTPANAMFFASMPFIYLYKFIYEQDIQVLKITPIVLGMMMSFFLVSEIPFMALKFKSFQWDVNKYKYILILISIAWVIIFHFMAAPFVLVSYILLSYLDQRIVVRGNKKAHS